MAETQWQRSVLALLRTITVLLSVLIAGLVAGVLSLAPGEARTTQEGGASEARLAQDPLAAFFDVAEQSSPEQLLSLKRDVLRGYVSRYNSASSAAGASPGLPSRGAGRAAAARARSGPESPRWTGSSAAAGRARAAGSQTVPGVPTARPARARYG